MNSVHQLLVLLFLGVKKKNNKIKSLFSHVSAQRCVELCETLDKLLELRPLLGVQGPATSHHCKPATKKTSQVMSVQEQVQDIVGGFGV